MTTLRSLSLRAASLVAPALNCLATLALLCLSAATLGTASAATLTVSNNTDSAAGSLRAAITNARAGDVIIFATNLSGQTITLTNGQLLVRSNLTIDASALSSPVIISGNNASRVLLVTNSATVVLKSLTLRNGQLLRGFGGGIFNSTNCTLTLSNCVLSFNSAGDADAGLGNVGGGALYNAGTLTLTSCTVSFNSATADNNVGPDASGGGLYNDGTATLTECSVVYNSASGGGNGFAPSFGGNGAGGGIYNGGRLTLNRTTLSGNDAAGGFGKNAASSDGTDGGTALGGGLYNAGSATLNQNTIGQNFNFGGRGGNGFGPNFSAGNGGDSQGGGIYNSGLLTLNQNTISACIVRQGVAGTGGPAGPTDGVAEGGGIFNTAIGTNCTLLNCLMARNLAPILVGSATNSDVSGVFSSRGHNLVGATNGSTGFGTNTDLKGTITSPLNPLLGTLTSRGGPTFTFAPQPGSPAIEAGDDSVTNSFATDQRGTGFPRRIGTHVDIGAYEADGGSAPSIASVTFDSVTVDPVTRLGSLVVRANVNPNSYQVPTTAWVQYGPSASYGLVTTTVSPGFGVGTSYRSVGKVLTDVVPGFMWHFRWVATNHFGTNFSSDQTFYISTGGIPGDANGDGFVTQPELDAVYANYVTNSPWLYMTNVAGLGNTNVLFSLSNSVLDAYSVQYTTNFTTWFNLGTATPRYLFTDTNAPALPKRYYRLRYP